MFLTIKDLTTTRAKSGLLPICPKTLRNMVARGYFPKPTHRIGGKDCWTSEVFENYVNSVKAEGN